MSGKNHIYDAWEERIISEAKGNCAIHYYLRSSSGNSLLAAVGTGKCKVRMLYVVSEEFLEAFGSNETVNAYTKWTARRDVMKWLISLMRRDYLPLTEPNLRLGHKANGSSINKEEKFTQEDPIKRFPKKLRSSRVHQRQDSGRSDATNLAPPEVIAASEPTTLKLNIDLSSNEPTGIQHPEPKPNQQASFQVGDKIEILCQDSGMRGCWFRCKIVKVSKNCLKVQYTDVDDIDGSGKLEEWVPALKLAAPDKLSLRHSGRLIIRPCPLEEEPSNYSFEVGAAVDAWWIDGWWESVVVTGASLSSNDNFHVFLPGEGRFLTLHRKDIRVSKDWVDNTWVGVKPQSDVLSIICSSLK